MANGEFVPELFRETTPKGVVGGGGGSAKE